MPLPRWLAHINKRVFNPMEMRRGAWVKNVLAAHAARLCIDGHEIELQSPRLVKKKDIWPMVPTTTKSYPGISSESELLRMDIRRQGSEP
jgi:hypothetical protein